MKIYTKEKFLELLSKTDFLDYTTFTRLNKAYQVFIFKLSKAIDLLCPCKKSKLKKIKAVSKKKKYFLKKKSKRMVVILKNYGKLLSP